jgi:DNA-binding transcriptional LysR family regulator
MHVKSLKVFCDIVGRRSFSQAASENGISQSGASQIVHQLEDSLGVRLIDRSKRPFVLTPEGEVYYDGCRKLVHRYYALQEEVRTLHQEVEGRVNVASIYSVGLVYANDLIDQFSRLHPKASVHIEYHHPNRVYELVAEDRVDIGLVSYPQSTRSNRALSWRDEPIRLVCAADHALAQRRSVSLQELAGLQIVGFDRDLKIRREIDRELARHGVELDVIMAFDNIDTIKHAVMVNSAASLLPEPAVGSELEMGSLVTVPVEGLDLSRSLGIIHRRNVVLGKTVQRFIQLLQQGAPFNDATDGVDVAEGDGVSSRDGPAEQPAVTAGACRGEAENGADYRKR